MEPISAVSRRDFLRTGGAIVIGFALGAALPNGMLGQGAAAAIGEVKSLEPNQVDSFLAFHVDGSVTLYTSRVDVGTGLRVAYTQIVAEELGVPVERISVIEGDTGLTPDHGGTSSSSGVRRGGILIRQAAATAHRAILNLAADHLKLPASELTLEGGVVRPTSGGAGVSVAALIGGKQLALAIDPKVPVKDPASYTVVGKPVQRPKVAEISTGKAVYVQDVRVPGMLHGRVIRPPALGAQLLTVDESSVSNIPGVRIVRQENFLAVAANDEWAAVRAARELKATWSEWAGLPGSEKLDQFIRHSEVDHDEKLYSRGGDPAAALPTAAKQLTATYSWPCQSHASLGPSCAIADVKRDGTSTIWTAVMGTYGLRTDLSKVFGIPQEKIRVIYHEGAGSYGGNGNGDAAADAFLLSQKLGAPVRVQWMRHDETGWDPKGPPQLLDYRGGIDDQGHIVSWDVETWLPLNRPGVRLMLGPHAAGIMKEHGVGAADLIHNTDPPYAVSNMRVVVHWLKETPLRPSNLRAPGKIANSFATEGFTDELAVAAGVDAVAYRLRGLTDQRGIDVIKRAAEMIGWVPRRSPNPAPREGNLLTGRGVAYVNYKQTDNYMAMAMDVAVDPAVGRIMVRRVTCAHDCGLIINPDGVRNQVEGCIVQTLSRTLHEEVKFDRSRVTSVDWVSYPILKFTELPSIEVDLIDRPMLPPDGAGEAATTPVAAALANAFFDATGIRLRSVPFTPERVKAALGQLASELKKDA